MGKVTTSQLDFTNESQEASPFLAGDHKASINRRARKHYKTRQKNINDPKKKRGLAFNGYPFKNIFDFTTAGDWDCVAAVERLPALYFSVDFIFLSFWIMGFIVELNY